LAACTAAAVQVPRREIKISNNEAIAAQTAGMAALTTGKVEWTEAQFSSLLSELIKQNMGKNTPISAIHAWFEPNNVIYLRVVLKPEVLKSGDTLDLAGTIEVASHHVVVKLQHAGIGNLSVSEAMLTMVNTQIDSALASANLGIAATVKTETGKLMIQIGG